MQLLRTHADTLASALIAVDTYAADFPEAKGTYAAMSRGMIRGYHDRWRHEQFEVLAVESTVTADLLNLQNQPPSRSRSFRLGGKIDVRLRDPHGRIIVMDHKTTSDDIDDQASPFWRMLEINSQASHYLYLEWLNERKVDFALWDVVRKPGIRPRKLTNAEAKQFVAPAPWTWFGLPVSAADRDAMLLDPDHRETPAMYEARVYAECLEKPDRYFGRRMVPRLDESLIEHGLTVWNDSQDILATRRSGHHRKNHNACMNYGKPCKFLGICSGYDSPDSSNWTQKANVHSELPELEGDGRDVLTNSRLNAWLECRQKHYLAYELGLERIDAEEREALLIGNLFHAGMEAWWGSQISTVEERKAA